MTKRNKFLLILAISAAALLLVGYLWFAVLTSPRGTASSFGRGSGSQSVFLMKHIDIGNTWKLSFRSASDGYTNRKFCTLKEEHTLLVADISCEEGELYLHLVQGDKTETYDVSNLDSPLAISLAGYEPGRLSVSLEAWEAKWVNLDLYVE